MPVHLNFEAALDKYSAILTALRSATFVVDEASMAPHSWQIKKFVVKPPEERSATIWGKEDERVQLVWRLFFDLRGDDYVLWLEARAKPINGSLEDASPPDTQSINHVSVEDIVFTLGMNLTTRLTEGVKAARRRGYTDGNLWTTADGRIYMWSSAMPGKDSPGYTIKLRDDATAEELVKEAITGHNDD